MRNVLALSLLAGALSTVLVPTTASAQVYVHVGPPAPVYERVPPPRAGYYWRTGYHRWDGNRYVWTPGEYIAPPRSGAVWVNGRWDHGDRGYYWHEGYWR